MSQRILYKILLIVFTIIGVLIIGFYSYVTHEFGKATEEAIHTISKKIVELKNDSTNSIFDSVSTFIYQSNLKLDSMNVDDNKESETKKKSYGKSSR